MEDFFNEFDGVTIIVVIVIASIAMTLFIQWLNVI